MIVELAIELMARRHVDGLRIMGVDLSREAADILEIEMGSGRVMPPKVVDGTTFLGMPVRIVDGPGVRVDVRGELRCLAHCPLKQMLEGFPGVASVVTDTTVDDD